MTKLGSVRLWLIILSVLGTLTLTQSLGQAITRNIFTVSIINCIRLSTTNVPFISNFESSPTHEVVALPIFQAARPRCSSTLAEARQLVTSNKVQTTERWAYVLSSADATRIVEAQLDTPDHMSMLWRGYKAALINDWPVAAQNWRHTEDFDMYLSLRARFLARIGNLDQAKATLLMGLEAFPDSTPLLYATTDLLYQDTHIGNRVVERLYHLKPPTPPQSFTQARQMIVQGKYTFAEPLLRDAIAWDNTNFYYYEALGQVLMQNGQPLEAAETLEHALKLSAPQSDRLWAMLQLGNVYTALGMLDAARQAYNQITPSSPLFSAAQEKLQALPLIP